MSRAALCLITAYAAACGAPAWVALGLGVAWGMWRYVDLVGVTLFRFPRPATSQRAFGR
jgi:hypothetical protein